MARCGHPQDQIKGRRTSQGVVVTCWRCERRGYGATLRAAMQELMGLRGTAR